MKATQLRLLNEVTHYNKGCYLNACTSHLYQTLVLPKLICTELICTTPWIYHGGPGTIEKRPNDFCRRQKSWVGAPAPGSPVRASFPECVRPYLEDGKNEVWYRWARYRWAWYRWVGKPEIGETKLCKLRGLAFNLIGWEGGNTFGITEKIYEL